MKKSDEHKTGKDKNTEELETYVQHWKDKYLRALADYQNLAKQTARERQEFAKYANEQLILEFIPVYDNLKTSLKHADEKASGWSVGRQPRPAPFMKTGRPACSASDASSPDASSQ